ncbi:MAG: hypothetical protein KAG96_07435 [Ichthyobacteriaceae bacterium]|nr:hypothetical protein [Ichthyobacteriaceae bacterium]
MEIEKPKQTRQKVNCKIVHTKSGLFFNGYSYYGKEKNTLSKDNSKKYLCRGKSDYDIYQLAFGNNMEREEDVDYIRNVIIYEGSYLHKIMLEFYDKYEYLPLKEFHIERESE